jgi:hypothetical protein
VSKSQTTSPGTGTGTGTGINLAVEPRLLTSALLPDADYEDRLR